MDNQQNKPQDNQKVEKSAEAQAEELFDKYGYYVDDSHSSVDFVVGRSVVMQNDFKSACLEIATSLQSRIAELEAELVNIKDTIEKDPVSFILVHALKYLNNENKLVLLENLGRRTNLTVLEKQNEKYEKALKKIRQLRFISSIHPSEHGVTAVKIAEQAIKDNG